jgi:ATP-dependent helicase/nuclease subunit A
MVDEYQDINMVQETILQLVSRQASPKPNLFMVGDMKQSIYRFRLAEPGLFLQKYYDFGSGQVLGTRRIDLSKNFRSRKEIIHGTNFIFKQIMSSDLGELAYDQNAELVFGANFPQEEGVNRAIELCLIDHKETENMEDGEDLEELSKVQVEARLVAKKILELLSPESSFKVYDKNTDTMRSVIFRDIVVLLRSTKEQSNTFLEEFRKMGIPAYADVGSGYLATMEVDTFLALLKIIDNPQQDIPLAAVLRSPIVGLTGEELAEVRAASPRSNFYKAVQCKAEENTELGQNLKSFLQRLDGWRTLARRDTLANLIWTLYRETGYFDYVGGMPNGRGRQANLRALHDRACQYEKTSFRGLFRFLRFIEKLQDSGSDLGMARALGENENVVRLMSIHKSKGLEFPVVFVGGLGKRFNMMDLNQNLLLHKDLGFGPDLVDPETRLVYPTIAKLALRQQIKMETLAEELRVLYVAMTRAREQLFLVGSANDLEKQARNWAALADCNEWALPVHALANAKNFLDWVCPALVRHNSGGELRKLAGWEGVFPREICNHLSSWKLSFYDKNGAQFLKEQQEVQHELMSLVCNLEKVEVEEKYKDLIKERLSWQYPYKEITVLPAKLAVSEVKERFTPKLLERPKFLQEQTGLSGAERGSALHTVLQHMNLKKSYQRQELEELLSQLVQKEILTEEQARVIEPAGILTFLNSDLGERLRQAERIYQELPFSFTLEANTLYQNIESSEETILVQGVIDILFEENDGLILLDYKTDYVRENTIEELINTYRIQLDLYSQAVEKILQQRVKEKVLYSFTLQKVIPIK